MTDEMALNLLGKWRGENYLRRKTELGRALSFCAGKTLKEAFVKNGFNLAEIEVNFGENEKPVAKGIEFNLSHSGEVALVAVSSDFNPVGCDVQKIEKKTDERLMAIAERFFSVKEVEKMHEIMQDGKERFNLLFYLIFSAKEAYIKMTGEGLNRPMNTFDIPIDDDVIVALDEKCGDVIEKYENIDGEKVLFSFYLPYKIPSISGLMDLKGEYVAVTCEKAF